MRISPFALALALTPIAGARAQPQSANATVPATMCARENGIELICGQHFTEDLFLVPGTPWVIGSWRHEGLVAISTRDRSTRLIFPSPTARIALDSKTYPDCPGAPGVADKDPFEIAGITVQPLGGRRFKVYAVRTEARAGIYAFDLDMAASVPSVTFRGCVPAPGTMFLNSITPLPDGGFATTHFTERGPGPAYDESRAKMLRGENTGGVLEWHPGRGWSDVPGSDMPGANGIELSRDGKWYFIDAWGGQRVVRLSRGANPPQRFDGPQVGFHVDNIRWTPAGKLLVAGQLLQPNDVGNRTVVIRVDPQTLQSEKLLDKPDTDLFKRGTVAIEVGKEIWVGSSRSNALAVIPATGQISRGK